jgi:hypothetical protein
MSCYSVAEEITPRRADYLVDRRGFEPLTSAVQAPARLTGSSLPFLGGSSATSATAGAGLRPPVSTQAYLREGRPEILSPQGLRVRADIAKQQVPRVSASPRAGPVSSISPWSKAAIRQHHNRHSPRPANLRVRRHAVSPSSLRRLSASVPGGSNAVAARLPSGRRWRPRLPG